MRAWLVGAFPPLHQLLLHLVLVLAVGKHIEELNGGFLPYIIPGTPHRFGGPVYVGNPTPMVCKAVSAIFRILIISSFIFGFRLASFSKEVRESAIDALYRLKKKAVKPSASGRVISLTAFCISAISYPSL